MCVMQTVPNTLVLPVQIQDGGFTVTRVPNATLQPVHDTNSLSPYVPQIPNVTTVTSVAQDRNSIQIGKLLSIDDSGQVLLELLHGDIEMVTLDQLCLYCDSFQAL
uniref:Glucosamine--fructose-6-phosphate aminotransferase [isomerizing] n=1 Tax=Lygus hesperus TaxID=30085 RepID=A0A0A9Y5V2_LYGHE